MIAIVPALLLLLMMILLETSNPCDSNFFRRFSISLTLCENVSSHRSMVVSWHMGATGDSGDTGGNDDTILLVVLVVVLVVVVVCIDSLGLQKLIR